MGSKFSEKLNRPVNLLPVRKQSHLRQPIFADETVTDIARNGLRLIQLKHGFRFGEDTVLLADYAASLYVGQENRQLQIADLGAGSGAATFLLSARLTSAVFLAVELDPHSLSALDRNRKINGLEDRITILEADYSQWTEFPPVLPNGNRFRGLFDLVIANPPYGLPENGYPVGDRRKMAREEQTMTLDQLIQAACCLLSPRGRFVMIHRTARLTDVLAGMRCHQIEPKQLRMIMTVENKPSARFLVAGVKHARPGSLKVQLPLMVRDHQHQLTDEVCRIYSNDPLLSETALYDGLLQDDRIWSGSICDIGSD
jgi:tRNA1Val (adenine37-N6)-methyltransferase